MIYYKNILLSVSNGLNSICVSNAPNPYANKDARMLARVCLSYNPIIASNGKKYYYFCCDYWFDANMIQYLLNCNGVLAYRRYSAYQAFCAKRRMMVRVPLEYLKTHENANAFINKTFDLQSAVDNFTASEMLEYVSHVQKRMRQK